MDSRTRVKKTMEFENPDRVPLHLNATKWVVEKLKNTLGVKTDKELLTALNIDFYDTRGIDLHSGTVPKYTGPESDFFNADWKGSIASFWGMKEIENKTDGGWTLEMDSPPLAGELSIKKLEQYLWPDNNWFDYSNLREEFKEWDGFSILVTGGSVFQHATQLRGMDHLMIDMLADKEIANFILDRITDFYYEYYRRMFEEAGNMIDVFALADDLGIQNSLLISIEMMDEFVFPRIRKMADLAHSYNIKLLFHSCGYVEPIIPKLIELGIDILDPIQPECMDPVEIKHKYGKKICLRGGLSVQNVISRGNREEVKQETIRIINELKAGGGYIFAPGHPVLQDDIPVENIITMYETAYKYGTY